MKQYLEIGKIAGTHGIKGDVKVIPWADDASFLCGFDTLFLGKSHTPLQVIAARVHKKNALLRFSGIDSPEHAQKILCGRVLYIDRNQADLPSGTYFIEDLVGLKVVDAETGERYGTLTDVLQTGATDVYEIHRDAKKPLLLPAIPEVVQDVDLNAGVMRVKLLEGLLDAL